MPNVPLGAEETGWAGRGCRTGPDFGAAPPLSGGDYASKHLSCRESESPENEHEAGREAVSPGGEWVHVGVFQKSRVRFGGALHP